ncbi:MAG TPA: helix-turn-helix domain-containing protein [Dehalococcoidia bacterium]|nr:helix-turn-helix domain-containing protein [Dehalococcoidia bacterium]
MSRFIASPSAEAEQWLTLGQACRLLGVDESTLRRWADAGQVRTFRTPGGHRRFSRSDLDAWLSGRRGPGNSQLVDIASTRIRRQMHRRAVHDAPWYAGLDGAARERMRDLGRRLVALVGDSFARRHRRGAIHHAARDLGREYGATLKGAGLSVSQAVEAFTFFRRTLEESARKAVEAEGASGPQAFEACAQILALADEVLLGMTEHYDGAAVVARPATRALN